MEKPVRTYIIPVGQKVVVSIFCTSMILGQKGSSDALFTPKMDIFKTNNSQHCLYKNTLKYFYQLGNHYLLKPLQV